ncbi:MAG: outer membrane lipoprotein-sorting protein [Fibrobacter sp.]|nr:outer membrane lipoprotein-sorting protein [Fibrobacter sp.]
MLRKLSILLVCLFAVESLPAQQPQIDATELISKADAKRRGKSSTGAMTMTVERPGWSRTVALKTWTLGTDYSLILITAPAKEKGQAFLKRKNEMWSFVPSIDRIIKMPSSMMGQSWMGSDFTNDDLLKESSFTKDYHHRVLGSEDLAIGPCWKVEMVPLENAAVVWGKLLVWVTKKDDNFVKIERYDEDGEMISTEICDAIRMVDDREIPTHMVMTPGDKPGNHTSLTIDTMDFDSPLSEAFFSQQNMKRVR